MRIRQWTVPGFIFDQHRLVFQFLYLDSVFTIHKIKIVATSSSQLSVFLKTLYAQNKLCCNRILVYSLWSNSKSLDLYIFLTLSWAIKHIFIRSKPAFLLFNVIFLWFLFHILAANMFVIRARAPNCVRTLLTDCKEFSLSLFLSSFPLITWKCQCFNSRGKWLVSAS